ncbi:hypothetical protein CN386_07920 [Bacillus cereus]|nr:hypothetical protein CN386_07920 [Bacillus cereus]
MSNHEKAKQLYEACSTDPQVSTLMPSKAFNTRGSIYHALVVGMLINQYATNEFDNDYIPVTKDTFFINSWDKEGWKNIKWSLYKLQKKNLIEILDTGLEKSVRIITDKFYNPEVYKH